MEEREEIDRSLTETMEGKLRPTPKLLNMQFRMEQLSRTQRFEEAAKLKIEFEAEVGFGGFLNIRVNFLNFECRDEKN